MGAIQTDHQTKTGAVNVDFVAGPNFGSTWELKSIFFQRTKTDSIDIIVEVLWGGVSYTLDLVAATGSKYYVFPNARIPCPIALDEKAKVRFRTLNTVDVNEVSSAIVQWSQTP